MGRAENYRGFCKVSSLAKANGILIDDKPGICKLSGGEVKGWGDYLAIPGRPTLTKLLHICDKASEEARSTILSAEEEVILLKACLEICSKIKVYLSKLIFFSIKS